MARECRLKKHANRLIPGLLSGTFPAREHCWLVPLFHPAGWQRLGKICRSSSRLYCRNSAAEQEDQSVQTDQSIRPASPSAKCDNARSIHQKYEGANRSCSDEEFGSPRRAAVDPKGRDRRELRFPYCNPVRRSSPWMDALPDDRIW